MANKSKHSAKIKPSDKTKLGKAASDLFAQYENVRNFWRDATKTQKQEFLQRSPLLSSIVDFFSVFSEVD